MGPILIFDKSTLQSLNPEEALWLHLYYSPNLTPLLLVETLADLEKATRKGRSPEDLVGSLAAKTLILGDRMNMHHDSIGRAELSGVTVELRHVPLIAGGQEISTANRRGLLFREPEEAQAVERWRRGAFLEAERQFAKRWRASLAGLDLAELRQSFGGARPRILAEARNLAMKSVDRDGSRLATLRRALDRFSLPDSLRNESMRRWRRAGGPRLREFAPFAAHVLTVEAFFAIALGADLISDQRRSNHIDMAYLYYLPFCMVFTSNDHLHEDVVPLFLSADQVFIKGADLKADLAALNDDYANQPEAVRAEGAMRFARYPPMNRTSLTADIWDRVLPGWRDDAAKGPPPLGEKLRGALAELMKKFSTADAGGSAPPPNPDSADAVVFESRVPLRVGRWSIFPPSVKSDGEG